MRKRTSYTRIGKLKWKLLFCLLFLSFGVYFVILALEPVHFQFRSESYKAQCSVPKLNPFDPSIKEFFWKPDPLVCDFAPSIVYVDEYNVLNVNTSALTWYGIKDVSGVVCEAKSVVRNTDDYNVDFGPTVTIFKMPTNLTSDFNHVICRTKKKDVIFDNVVHGVTPNRTFKAQNGDSLESDTQYSVMMFGLDSISRSASIRYLPKTRQYLEKLGAYDFKGYMKLGDNTIPNFIPLTTGLRLDENECPDIDHTRFDGYPLIWKNFSAHGYRTMFAEDMPHISCFENGLKGFEHPPADHYMRPFWLGMAKHDSVQYKLSNIYRFLEDKGVKVKKTSVFCNQDTPNHVVLINYLRQFFLQHRDHRKFSISFLTELAHTFLNFLNYGDEPFVEMLQWLKYEGFLDSTIVIFFSDHGSRYNKLRNTFVGRIEARMPFLSMLVPDKLKKKFPHVHTSLQTNTERLVTAYDIHQTLVDIVKGNYDKPTKKFVSGRSRGVSLFQPVDKDRSCYDAWVPEEFCACYKSTPVDIETDPDIIKIGTKIVDRVNEIVSDVARCDKLTLSRVVSAEQLSLGLKHVGTSHNKFSVYQFFKPETNRRKYTISVETVPGNAIFEASMEFLSNRDIQVIGSVDRTNMYGNQSHCVESPVLKLYCYCK